MDRAKWESDTPYVCAGWDNEQSTNTTMSTFAKLKDAFNVNWTTILVGWKGLGVFSPWPERSDEFPSLISANEVSVYAGDRLAITSNPVEDELIVRLFSLDLASESRQRIAAILKQLSDLDRGDPLIELRKWRLVLLEELLVSLPHDAIEGLVTLFEFWQEFGFPIDSPHMVQGRENTFTPEEYYHDDNFQRLIDSHRNWIRDERANLIAFARA